MKLQNGTSLGFLFYLFLSGLIPVPPSLLSGLIPVPPSLLSGLIPVSPSLLSGLIPVPPLLSGLIPVPPLLSGLIPKNQSEGGLGTRIGSPVCELQALLSWVGPGNEANS